MRKRVYLSGGLGNQMFQYAFYMSLRSRGIECVLDDCAYYLASMHNGFELDKVFNTPEHFSHPSFIRRLYTRFILHYLPTSLVYSDRRYEYCEDVYSTHNCLLVGNWLSPKYFESITKQIIDIYSFKNVSFKNLSAATEIRSTNSVSVHIRRGDYLKLPHCCVCDENYYLNAIALIQQKVDSPMFYVFSNDPSWCEDFMMRFGVNFKIVDWNQGGDSYQDMYLMTQCKHNIIANSTFSWWGAWLNRNPEKVVISPSKWFTDSDHDINLSEWLLIDTSV